MERIEAVPSARVVSRQWFARTRAIAARGRRAVRRSAARIAQQALVLALTAIGFALVLGMTLMLAQQAITFHPIPRAAAAEPRPLVIYLMHQPACAPVAPHTK